MQTSKNSPKSPRLKEMELFIRSRQLRSPSKLLLLTAHRREDFGKSLARIFEAVSMVIREHEDVIVIYPIHLNPEVTLSAEDCFGKQVFSHMEEHRLLKTNTHLNRFLIVAALENAELLSLI
jgi:UDP-N-acetylglucosamine 2-epimerase